jgi:hypothetical protein
MRVRRMRLPYYDQTNGKFRDYRHVELTIRNRFARICINGQYRSGKRVYDNTRYANPGWSFGTESVLINWTHFRRHCWHLAFEAFRRGITFSYGRNHV